MDLLKRQNNFSDVALILDKLEFALLKLERVTDKYCKFTSSNQQSQLKTLLLENKTRGEIATNQCKQYLDCEEILPQVKITSLSIDDFFDGSSSSSSVERSPENECVAKILDIKCSIRTEEEKEEDF